MQEDLWIACQVRGGQEKHTYQNFSSFQWITCPELLFGLWAYCIIRYLDDIISVKS